jgi:hypothetical protein
MQHILLSDEPTKSIHLAFLDESSLEDLPWDSSLLTSKRSR